MSESLTEDPFRQYTREELFVIADRLEWGSCHVCGAEVITSMKGIDFFDATKEAKLDDYRLPNGTDDGDGKRICRKCSTIQSDAHEAKYLPRFVNKVAAKVHAIYVCPLCKEETKGKAELKAHLRARHDVYHLKQELRYL